MLIFQRLYGHISLVYDYPPPIRTRWPVIRVAATAAAWRTSKLFFRNHEVLRGKISCTYFGPFILGTFENFDTDM